MSLQADIRALNFAGQTPIDVKNIVSVSIQVLPVHMPLVLAWDGRSGSELEPCLQRLNVNANHGEVLQSVASGKM